MLNPIAAILTQMHAAWIGPSTFTEDGHTVTFIPHGAARAIGGAPRLLIPLGIIFGVFCLGLWFFNREAPRIAENL
jgi:ABC-2 type transport system permease protein